MRFSDMMGSGDDKSSQRSTPSESEALIVDALAPYVGRGAATVAPAAVEPVAAPDDPEVPDAAEAAEFEVAPAAVTPVAPAVLPVAPPAPPAAVELPSVAPRDPIAATIADFAPISDDLLPRRR